jgi:hypothetical protein
VCIDLRKERREQKVQGKKEIDNLEAVKNLLLIMLLKQGVDPKLIEIATGMAEKTVRNRFPASLLGERESD